MRPARNFILLVVLALVASFAGIRTASADPRDEARAH
jgi:hypothetical protein